MGTELKLGADTSPLASVAHKGGYGIARHGQMALLFVAIVERAGLAQCGEPLLLPIFGSAQLLALRVNFPNLAPRILLEVFQILSFRALLAGYTVTEPGLLRA